MPIEFPIMGILLVLSLVPIVNSIAIPAFLLMLFVVLPIRLWQAIGDIGR
ncbi:MAG: hypothetical protein H7A12_07275 [Pseudomonadales bacterium]|jgi:hypothetical protein|nr:hypothetical protein [Pseudomonadales bacterium]MCP5320611.1 hypothetical protein [Pseudomonadales bacterium]MCP5336644.1 hypothetical protein [Pseudomonadales bacterium]